MFSLQRETTQFHIADETATKCDELEHAQYHTNRDVPSG